jgi:hypothetical protein
MSGNLSLDEFATAPRKQRPPVTLAASAEVKRLDEMQALPQPAVGEEREKGATASGASKALRQVKRARMKGASHFVNVNLDRDTKQRLKLASFNMDTSMQAIMEKAIRQYLDANGY